MKRKKVLTPLGLSPFILQKTKQVNAQKNYHVEIEHQYFSIQYTYVDVYVQAYYTNTSAEIYHKDKKIANHKREPRQYFYHTTQAQIPSNHTAYLQTKGYDKQYFIDQAKQYECKTLDEAKLILLQVIEERYDVNPTIMTAQAPLSLWSKYIDEPTLADAFLNRLTGRAHKIELKGE